MTNDTTFKQGYIHVEFPSSIEKNTDKLNCLIIPEPTDGIFTADITSFKEDLISVKLFNTTGTVVYEENNIPANDRLIRNFNLSAQPDGVYFLRIIGKMATLSKKIIVQK